METNSYYELNQDQKSTAIINSLGPTVFPSHFHKKPEITYLTNGSCSSVIVKKEYSATKDDIIFVSEYSSHSYSTSNDAQRIVFTPSNEINADFVQISEKKHFAYLLDDKVFNRERILPIFKEMLDCKITLSNKPNALWLANKACTNMMYVRLLERYSDSMILRNTPTETLDKILAYIDENYHDRITLDSLANAFGYNTSYLSRFFNNNIGTNLNDYVNSVRIKSIIENYNINDKKTMLDIALSIGFESMSSFYRAFKKNYNQAPKDYFATFTSK